MKKILLGLVISALLLGGCSNKSEEAFQSAMTNGIEAVANEEYAKAEAYFETALKEKSDDKKAKNYLAGVEDIQTLLKYQEEGNLEEGLTLSTKISEDKDAPDTIKKQAKVIDEEFTSIKTTLDESTKLFTDAEKLAEEKKYSESNEKLKVIQDKKLEGTYYTELLAKTTEMSKKNSAEIEKAAAEKAAADQKAKEEAEQKAQAEAEQKAAEEAEAKQESEQQVSSGNESNSSFAITESQAIGIAEEYFTSGDDLYLGEEGQTITFENMNPGKIFLSDNGGGFYNIYLMVDDFPSAACAVDANTGEASQSVMHFRGLGVEIITTDAPK